MLLFSKEWGNSSAKDRGCAHGPTGGLRAVWPMLKNMFKKIPSTSMRPGEVTMDTCIIQTECNIINSLAIGSDRIQALQCISTA